MSRPLRIQYPNAWYHVMHRGAGRKEIFFNNTHRFIFLELLEECHQMFNIQIHAYCLMDNHYHLLLCTPEANLSRAMRHLNGVYTQRLNRIRKTDGSLFRGRYKAQIIEEDCYLMVVSRYIHLNPVTAGLVKFPSDYKWSSFSSYLNIRKTPTWLTKNVIISYLTSSVMLSHVKDYQDYVENYDINEINVFVSTKLTSPIIGSDEFKSSLLSNVHISPSNESSPDIKRSLSTPSTDSILNSICIFYKIDLDTLRSTKQGRRNWPRLVYMYISRKHFGHCLASIAKPLGCSYRTVSAGIVKCHHQLQNELTHAHQINEIAAHVKVSG